MIKKLKDNKELYKISIIVVAVMVLGGMGMIGIKQAFSSPYTTETLKDQEVENLKFKNAKIEENKLIVEVEAEEEKNLSTIEVTYKDKEGNIITTLSGYIGNELEKGEVKELVVDTDEDISKTYSIEYKIKN